MDTPAPTLTPIRRSSHFTNEWASDERRKFTADYLVAARATLPSHASQKFKVHGARVSSREISPKERAHRGRPTRQPALFLVASRASDSRDSRRSPRCEHLQNSAGFLRKVADHREDLSRRAEKKEEHCLDGARRIITLKFKGSRRASDYLTYRNDFRTSSL